MLPRGISTRRRRRRTTTLWYPSLMYCVGYVFLRCLDCMLAYAIPQFLEGFFQHGPHCKDFITLSDGLTYIGRLTALPCLPYDFSNSIASDSLVQVMRTLVDFATNETLFYLSKIVHDSLQDTKNFWQKLEPSSKLLPFLEIDGMCLMSRTRYQILTPFRYQPGGTQRPVPKPRHFAHQDFAPLGCLWHCWVFSWSGCHHFTSNFDEFLWWSDHSRPWRFTSSYHMGKYGTKCSPLEERDSTNESCSVSLKWNSEFVDHQSY